VKKLTDRQREIVRRMRAGEVVRCFCGAAPLIGPCREQFPAATLDGLIRRGLVEYDPTNDRDPTYPRYSLTDLGKTCDL
jgi:hypothetical protein